MITKAKIKFIKSLQIKKYRTQEQCFIVEGAKSISELIKSYFVVREICGTQEYIAENSEVFAQKGIPFSVVSTRDLQALGSFKTNEAGVAIAHMKKNEKPVLNDTEYGLVLDDIRDPGNLGTIIRTADWYGIDKIIASPDSTDFYNPKVIASSMGSFTRVRVYYTELTEFVRAYSGSIYGAFLEGESLYTINFNKGGLIVMGNESNGISRELEKLVTNRVTIPRIGKAESLNVATATAIVLDNIRKTN
jgi:TrmH family RNA methyltransferase